MCDEDELKTPKGLYPQIKKPFSSEKGFLIKLF